MSEGLFIPREWIPTLATAAAVINLVPIAAGVGFLFRPAAALPALGFDEPSNPRDQRLVDGLVQMYSVRQVAGGLGGIILWFFGAYRPMGWTMLVTGGLIAVTDGLVAKKTTGKHVMTHWVAVPVSVFFGASLAGFI